MAEVMNTGFAKHNLLTFEGNERFSTCSDYNFTIWSSLCEISVVFVSISSLKSLWRSNYNSNPSTGIGLSFKCFIVIHEITCQRVLFWTPRPVYIFAISISLLSLHEKVH